jgi:replicative DNA helicase
MKTITTITIETDILKELEDVTIVAHENKEFVKKAEQLIYSTAVNTFANNRETQRVAVDIELVKE